MKCPKCSSELSVTKKHGIEVDYCESCEGMWLDHAELDQLEDRVYDQDQYKGSVMSRKQETGYLCPKCDENLITFKYRFNDLELEYCPNEHGFWLDAGEDLRIHELMKQREKDMNHKFRAEADFANFLSSIRNKSFISKIRGFFR